MAEDEKKPVPEQGDIFNAVENTRPEPADTAQEPESACAEEETSGSFEALLKRLEGIVEKMESGGLSLDESMKLYEEGIKKAGILTAKLADARNKVMKLVEGMNGEMSLEEFDEGEA